MAISERRREMMIPTNRVRRASSFRFKDIFCATQREMAVSIPAEVKEKQSAYSGKIN